MSIEYDMSEFPRSSGAQCVAYTYPDGMIISSSNTPFFAL